jgi:hypothetical protein
LKHKPQTLSRYIAYTLLSIASSPKYLTGAHHFLHELFPDFDNNRANFSVQATIHDSIKVCAEPIRREEPIRISHLLFFIDAANQSCNYDNLLFATIMSCCFYGCHCSGKLVLKSKRNVDWQKIIKQSSLHFSPGYAGYCLPYHKSVIAALIFFSLLKMLLILSPSSKSLYVYETLFMARTEPYSSVKTVLTPLLHGSMPNSSPSLTEPSVAIPQELEQLLSMQL